MTKKYYKKISFIIILLIAPFVVKSAITDSVTNNISPKNQALKYSALANNSFSKGEYPSALEFDKKALNLFQSINDDVESGKIYCHIAEIHFKISDYDNSLKNYLEALRLFENGKQLRLLNNTKKNIGDLYVKLEQCDQAFNQLNQAKSFYLSDQKKYKQELPYIFQSIGIAYGRCGSLDSALHYFQKSIELADEEDGIFIGGLLNNIGAIYSKREENEKALEYYNQSLNKFQIADLKQGVAVSISNIAYIYMKQKKYEKSKELYLKALALFEETKSLLYLRDNYLNLSEVYEKSNHPVEALKYNNLYLDLDDSITNSDILSRMGDLQMQFEIRKKDQELLLLDQEKLLIEQKNELTQTRLYLLVGGIILLIIIAGLIFRNLKVSLKINHLKQQVLKQEKEQLTLDLGFKNIELEGFALRIVEKNDLLEHLKKEIKEINPDIPENAKKLKEITSAINNNLYIDKDRKEFEIQLDKLHQSFFSKLNLQFPELTKNERRLCSLLVLDLSSKDIATILNISPDGVKKGRYRLRKKLNIETEINTAEFLKTI